MFGTTTQTVQRSVIFWTVALLFRVLWLVLRFAVVCVWRFAWGMPLDGNAHTDATFLSSGTEDVREKKWFSRREPTRWAYLPGYKRALIRWTGVGAVVAWWRWPTQVAAAAVVVSGVALGLAVWRVWYRVRTRRHYEWYVEPLHVALAHRLGVSDDVLPEQWLEIPLDFRGDDDAAMTLHLPRSYVEEQDRLLSEIVPKKLGLSPDELLMHVDLEGPWPYAVFTHAPHPPALVTFEDVRELLESMPDSRPLIGLGRYEQPASVDLDAEAPHTLLSMAPGAGKSMFAKGQAAQLLHNGHQVVILDIKRHSHRWARGVPGVVYLRDIADIHNGLIWLGAEGNERNRQADELADDEEVPFTRIYVLAEEMNALIRALDKYWKKIRPKKDMPSPAIDAWLDLGFMGRAVKMHLLAIAQSGTARAMGGPEGRETFSNRILGRYTRNAWRMLNGDIPMPKPSKHRGRVQVVVAGDVEEAQVVMWTDAEAREWAMSGVPSQSPKLALTPSSAGDGVGTVPELAEPAGSAPAVAAATEGPGEPALPELVTLREACEWGVVQVSEDPAKALVILRSERNRDPEFPDAAEKRGLDHLYDPVELQRWERNRPRAGGLELESGGE